MLEPLVTWLTYRLLNFLINLIWGFSLALWYIEKAIAWLGDQIITSNVWDTIIDGLLTGMASSMPNTLQTVIYGTGGGLFYLALMLLGLMIMIPFITRIQPGMELGRLFMWTVVVTVLFISSTGGYDLIGAIERGRMATMANISSSYGSNDVSQLVAGPMSATAAEINVNEFELPAAYESIYFPDPTAFETVEVVFYDAPILGTSSSTLTVETDASIQNRLTQATLGVVLVILNIIPTAMVVILLASFIGLTATSLVIILFFIMALPLGMFESGMLILNQIIRRYMLIWMLSIFMAVFPSVMLGISELTLVPPVTIEALFLYAGVLLVAVYATYHVARWIFSIATESFSVIGSSINTLAYGGGAMLAGSGQAAQGMGYGAGYGSDSGSAPTPHKMPPKVATASVLGALAAPVAIKTGALAATTTAAAVPTLVKAGAAAATYGHIDRQNRILLQRQGRVRTGEQDVLINKIVGDDFVAQKEAELNEVPATDQPDSGGVNANYLVNGSNGSNGSDSGRADDGYFMPAPFAEPVPQSSREQIEPQAVEETPLLTEKRDYWPSESEPTAAYGQTVPVQNEREPMLVEVSGNREAAQTEGLKTNYLNQSNEPVEGGLRQDYLTRGRAESKPKKEEEADDNE